MHAFRNILLAITRTHTSEMEFKQAFRLAKDNRARLIVALFDNSLNVIHKLQFIPLEKRLESMLRDQLNLELLRIKGLAWDEGLAIETHVVAGRPRDSIIALVKELQCDLVIKLADPSGAIARNQLTGNDLALLRKCPVPLLMMADKPPLPENSGRIMVAFDAGDAEDDTSNLNRRLFQYGLYLANQEQARLHFVSVWNLPVSRLALHTLSDDELCELQETTRKRYQSKQSELLAEFGLDEDSANIHVHLVRGQPAHEIQRLANDIDVDLIVMGTLGRHSDSMIIGSTAENILNNIYCSILAVKPEGYISPLS